MKEFIVGKEIERIDGFAKVTGQQRYTGDVEVKGALMARFVPASICRGRVVSIDISEALAFDGVVDVLTHETMPMLKPLGFYMGGGLAAQSLQPMQSDQIAYHGQWIAMVVAKDDVAARMGARLVRTTYEVEAHSVTIPDDTSHDLRQAEAIDAPFAPDRVSGDADAAFESASVQLERSYATSIHHHNPIEPPTTCAHWEGDVLTVYEASQGTESVRQGLAQQFAIPPENVRVVSTSIGGSFGQKAFVGRHVALVVAAARKLSKPVRFEMPRDQMFQSANFRPATRQIVKLGAKEDGTITSAHHIVRSQTSRHDRMPGLGTDATARAYGIPNFRGEEWLVPLDTHTPGFVRAPFEQQAVFAFESAIDELAEQLGMDPIALRLHNDTAHDPITGKPFSLRLLNECLKRGSKSFGWSERRSEPAPLVDGWQTGLGVAAGYYKSVVTPTDVTVILSKNARITLQLAGHEMGQGIRTVITQAACDAFGLMPDAFTVQIGDTKKAIQHITAGSWGTQSVMRAVSVGANALAKKLGDIARNHPESPLLGTNDLAFEFREGMMHDTDGRSIGLDTLHTMSGEDIKVDAFSVAPGQPVEIVDRIKGGFSAAAGPVLSEFVSFAFAAHFVEVRVQAATGRIIVPRVHSVIDCGKVINPQLARSQILGQQVWGIGATLSEVSEVDARMGGIANRDLADYVVPVCSDIGTLEVEFLDRPDTVMGGGGAKGLGEVGMIGLSAAIANAWYDATGRRARSLPLRMGSSSDS